MKQLFLSLIFILYSIGIGSATIKGKVVKVTDGDSITILTEGNRQVKIRLDGIDCPERGQDYGTKATDFTKELCAGKDVIIDSIGIDRYRRVLGIVWVDSVNVNEALLINGLAWRYKYNKSEHYLSMEQEARGQKLNIWSMKNPVAPWDFRKK